MGITVSVQNTEKATEKPLILNIYNSKVVYLYSHPPLTHTSRNELYTPDGLSISC